MIRDGFLARQRWGLGAFLTSADIAKHSYVGLDGILGAVRGVRIDRGTRGYPLPLLHGTKTGSCIPNFFLDGAPFYVDGAAPIIGATHPFSDLAAAAPPERIKGVEVYSTSGSIPAQYDLTSSTGCGSIVIWTR